MNCTYKGSRKKVILLVAIKASPPFLVAGPLKKKNFIFCGFPYMCNLLIYKNSN